LLSHAQSFLIVIFLRIKLARNTRLQSSSTSASMASGHSWQLPGLSKSSFLRA
jgi:hypothetical protein